MWAQPVKWNREAEAAGERHRVFCASLADVFEGDDTMPSESWKSVDDARERLTWLIINTPHLDWLLLTKRPQNVMEMLPEDWMSGLPPNVWIGTSVENQAMAEERIPHLLQIPAKVRFLSCEPLLGAVDLSGWATDTGVWKCPNCRYTLQKCYLRASDGAVGLNTEQVREVCPNDGATLRPLSLIDWVIVGGESGANARPMHPDWARGLRDQCVEAGVAYFFKQWGGTTAKAGGRLLDGREWSEYPEVSK